MTTKEDLVGDFGRLGICDGDTIMVHASLKAIGPVDGGPAMIVEALVDAVGQRGNLLAYVSWDRSPYEETLNGRRLSDAEREAWPAFDPATAGTYRGFGVLNDVICGYPGAWRSAHPDASMAAIGPRASELVRPHRLGDAYGPGSPLERFVSMRVKRELIVNQERKELYGLQKPALMKALYDALAELAKDGSNFIMNEEFLASFDRVRNMTREAKDIPGVIN
jgi:aminoglycoside 3-N-acetyltransferase/aminoglycoside 3-N-acetyltransferase-2